MGPAWKETVVVVATEFGRTARINGTNGTDHGTASTALLLGGALKKGGIVGDWPTLAQAGCSRTATPRRPSTCAACSRACCATTSESIARPSIAWFSRTAPRWRRRRESSEVSGKPERSTQAMVLNIKVMRSSGHRRDTPRATCGTVPRKTTRRLGFG